MIPLIGTAVLLGKPALEILFGAEFRPAFPAFVWLMPAIMVLSMKTLLITYVGSLGMPMVTVFSPALAVVVNVRLNLLLIPALGIVGASLASVGSHGRRLLFSVG